ncbi:MBL fold metallo-hydrolase [Falsiroseomonas sp.]|uniref:MBL fold metallo-hydrolase n=1 Tax=Falsiroseomonas sp. TaxID=2870721 RepID=UPI003F701E99
MTLITRRGGALLGAAALATSALPRHAAAQAAPTQAAPVTNPGFHRFRIGGFTVTTLFDGTARLPLEGFVANASVADVQAVLAESFLPTDHYLTPYTVTVVETGSAVVMFDAGTGGQLSPQAGRMAANMAAAGLDPARITHVVFTHFHGDHITGLTTAQNQAVFPNAEIVVPAAEWRFWTDATNEGPAPARQKPNFANTARRFGPYQGKIRQVQEGQEAVPGIRAVSAFGHSPGHTCWHVSDGAAQLMVLGDITHRPELFARRPELQVMFDFDPTTAVETRKRMLDRVATDRIHVTGYHFPFPAHGFIAKEGQGYRYVPADWAAS